MLPKAICKFNTNLTKVLTVFSPEQETNNLNIWIDPHRTLNNQIHLEQKEQAM
jgi:hypothetical protein